MKYDMWELVYIDGEGTEPYIRVPELDPGTCEGCVLYKGGSVNCGAAFFEFCRSPVDYQSANIFIREQNRPEYLSQCARMKLLGGSDT